MIIVGLTGGIACGKSAVTARLQREGVAVLDCDVIAREAVEPGQPALRAIEREFGRDVVRPDGTLDRKRLGAVVFGDDGKRKRLQSITGPAILRRLAWSLLRHAVRGTRVVVVDAPTLYETKYLLWVCAKVVVVATAPELQLQRLMARDGSSAEEAMARINAQMPLAEKVAMADVVVWNSGSRDDLDARAGELARELDRWGGGWRLLASVPGCAALVAAAAAVAAAAHAWSGARTG